MGTTLSVVTGYGFAVPVEITNAYADANQYNEEWDGFYEHLDDRIRKSYPNLDHDMAYYYDYVPDEDDTVAYAVFAKSTMRTHYGAGVFERSEDPELGSWTNIEMDQLRAFADELGVPNDNWNSGLSYLTLVSIG